MDDSSDSWEDYLEELDKELNDSGNKSNNLKKTSTVLR